MHTGAVKESPELKELFERQAFEAGADGFIPKEKNEKGQINAEVLINKINEVFERKTKEKPGQSM